MPNRPLKILRNSYGGKVMDTFANIFDSPQVALFGKALLILIASIVSTFVINFLIARIFKSREGTIFDSKRVITLRVLLKSVVKYTVFFVAFIMILGVYGVPTTSILASAGVVGLAVGFGAQSLVKDVISGFFIIFENQYSVGEYIKTKDFEGIVEEIGLRATRIRDFNGGLHIVPNGHIETLTNYNRGKIRAMVDIGIAYQEDVDKAISVIAEACAEMAKDSTVIVEGPEVLGVVKIKESEVTIRVLAYTKPMEQWAVERILLKTIKLHLDTAGIQIPYPRSVMLSYPVLAKDRAGGEQDGEL